MGTAGVSRVGAAAVGGLAWEPRVCGRRAVGECVCASREWSLCGGGGAVAGLGPGLWRVCAAWVGRAESRGLGWFGGPVTAGTCDTCGRRVRAPQLGLTRVRGLRHTGGCWACGTLVWPRVT